MMLQKAVDWYLEYYKIRQTRIGAVALFFIYILQMIALKRLDSKLKLAKTI